MLLLKMLEEMSEEFCLRTDSDFLSSCRRPYNIIYLIFCSLDLTVHVEELQQRPCAPLLCAEYHRPWQRLVLRRLTQVRTKLLHVLRVLESVSRVIFFIMILITCGGDVIVIKIIF